MENFLNNDYDTLANVANNFIQKCVQTHQINIGELYQNMEAEFAKFNFRNNNHRGGVENILLVRLDYIGDFIMAIPAIREIRMNYPFARITLLVNKVVYPVAELCPYVNEVLISPAEHPIFLKGNLLEYISLYVNFARENLWKRRFDLAICLNQGVQFFQHFVTWFSGARERVGYIFQPEVPPQNNVTYLLLTKVIQFDKRLTHAITQVLYILKAMGLQIYHTNLEFWYDATDLYYAKKLLEGFAPDRIKIAVGIGAKGGEYKYPIELYLQAFKKIINKGAAIVILGGPKESESASFIQKNLPDKFVKNLVDNSVNLRISAATMSQMNMYIGNDTGTMHLAVCAHIPIVAVHRVAKDLPSPNILDAFFPWQTNAIILQPEHQLGDCQKANNPIGCIAGKPHCITQIEPEEIVAAYETMANFIKKSGIKNLGCSQIMRRIDQISELNFESN